MKHFVMMQTESGNVWPLDLHSETLAECIRAVRWQWHGGNNQPMHICKFDKETESFVAIQIVGAHGFNQSANCAGPFPLKDMARLPYTEKAWNAFHAYLRDEEESR